ncbi:MAG: hypothetical protein WA865_00860 [Spirulinaceae cyanobacterium]
MNFTHLPRIVASANTPYNNTETVTRQFLLELICGALRAELNFTHLPKIVGSTNTPYDFCDRGDDATIRRRWSSASIL